MFGHDFGHTYVSWKTYSYIYRHSDFGILSSLGASSNLSVRGYCISWLSVAIWNNIHHFCGGHLRRRRALISKKLHGLQSRLLPCHHGTRLCLCTSVFWVLPLHLSVRVLGLVLLLDWLLVPHPIPGACPIGLLVLFVESNTSITKSHKSRASSPSILKPATNERNSDSVEL